MSLLLRYQDLLIEPEPVLVVRPCLPAPRALVNQPRALRTETDMDLPQAHPGRSRAWPKMTLSAGASMLPRKSPRSWSLPLQRRLPQERYHPPRDRSKLNCRQPTSARREGRPRLVTRKIWRPSCLYRPPNLLPKTTRPVLLNGLVHQARDWPNLEVLNEARTSIWHLVRLLGRLHPGLRDLLRLPDSLERKLSPNRNGLNRSFPTFHWAISWR